MSDYAAVVSASAEIKNNVRRVLECTGSSTYAIAAVEALTGIRQIADSDEMLLRSAAIVMVHSTRTVDCGVILCSKLLTKALDDFHYWDDILEILKCEIKRGSMVLLLKILVNLPPACNFCRLYVLPIGKLMPLEFKEAAFKEFDMGTNHSIFTLLSRFFVLPKVSSIDYGGILKKAIESPFLELEYGLKASQDERDERFAVARGLETCFCEMQKSFPKKQLDSKYIMKSIKFMLEFDLVEPAANTAVVLWECLEPFEKLSVGTSLSKCLDKGLAAYSKEVVKNGNVIMHSLLGIDGGTATMLETSLENYIIKKWKFRGRNV